MSRIQIIVVVFDLALLLIVFNLFRKGRLKEKYALSWLLGLSVLLLLSLFRPLLERVSFFFGVYYPPSFLFLSAFALVLAILLHFSTAISELEKRQKRLLERIILLEEKLKKFNG